MSAPPLQEPIADPDVARSQPGLRPIADVVVGGALTGGLAAAAAGLIDALWSWRALDQFVPDGLGRLRIAIYLATSYALLGLAVGAAIALVGLLYFRVTRLGLLVRHGLVEHQRARARDPRAARILLSLVLAFVPIATLLLLLVFPRLVRDLQQRHHFPLEIAVAMGASVVVLAVAAALALVVARGLEELLRRVPIDALSSPLAPAVALALMIGLGGAVVLARAWKTVAVLHLRTPAIALLAVVLALPLLEPGARLARRWHRLRPLHRGLVLTAIPIGLFALTALAGSRASIIKGSIAYSGGGDRLTRVWKRMIDRDRDGYSPWFGGDDCDDGDARIHPGATDIPDDGIDQNCVHGDARSQRDPDEVGFIPVPATIPADTNVILVTIDTLRSDHVGAYGYPRGTTPTIDRIGAQGTVFEAAWAHAPSTRYSMPAILTGRLPLDVYYDTSIAGWPGLLPKATTIAEILHGQGLASGAFTNYWYFDKQRRMDQGFDVYDNDNARLHQGADPAHTKGSSSREQTDKALAFVASHAQQRFFLWVHYYDPHHEYEPHAGFERLGTSEVDRYDQEIAFTDQQLGRLVADLEARGLWDKTIIVITGDHGEGFGEHGVKQHGYDLYTQQTKVPLVVRVPGLAPRRSRTAVGHVDILPTLANLVGAAPSVEMMGRSLLGLVAGAPDDLTRAVFQQLSYEGNHEKRGAATADCHVLYNVSPHTSWEIYRLDTDPDETRDRASTPGPCATVKDTFSAWYDNAQIPAGAGAALLTTKPELAAPLEIDFGSEVRLLALDLPAEVHPGDTVDLTWTWEARGRLEGGWKIFVHLEGDHGGRFTADHAPPRPFDWWQRGQYLRYTTTVTVPSTAPAGEYGLWMGLWRKNDRRPVHAPAAFRVVENRVRAATLKVVR